MQEKAQEGHRKYDQHENRTPQNNIKYLLEYNRAIWERQLKPKTVCVSPTVGEYQESQ